MKRYLLSLIFLTTIVVLSIPLEAQDILLQDLILFHTTKDAVKIDSVLSKSPTWDCNCIRQFDDISKNREWIYDVNDSSKESVNKDRLKLDEIGHGFGCVIMYTTSDKNKAGVILKEMQATMKEERVTTVSKKSIKARMSFYVGKDVVIETMIGENEKEKLGKYAFIVMDRADYDKGLQIK